MKNVQLIDGAENCEYAIFRITEAQFKLIFPEEGQDIEFNEDLSARIKRMGKNKPEVARKALWVNKVDKKKVRGIHGTLFFGLRSKKKFYPQKREDSMVDGFSKATFGS